LLLYTPKTNLFLLPSSSLEARILHINLLPASLFCEKTLVSRTYGLHSFQGYSARPQTAKESINTA